MPTLVSHVYSRSEDVHVSQNYFLCNEVIILSTGCPFYEPMYGDLENRKIWYHYMSHNLNVIITALDIKNVNLFLLSLIFTPALFNLKKNIFIFIS